MATKTLQLCTWNVAAINNNPLEYWTTYDHPDYKALMVAVEEMVESPADRDVTLGSIFPASAVEELAGRMNKLEGFDGVAEVLEIWRNDFSQRPIVSGFLKDKVIGSKRFMSMPDRYTNTINTLSSIDSNEPGPTVCRPSVINNYVGDMTSFQAWWAAWILFMFEETQIVATKRGNEAKTPCRMLPKILRSRYPALSEEEERISLPMQVLCLALFDCILVHMMNVLSPSGEWLTIKRALCDALYTNKKTRTLEILESPRYAACDVIFLQEVAGSFVLKLQSSNLTQHHHVVAPAKMDCIRDQNSILLLKKETFPDAVNILEVTDTVLKTLQQNANGASDAGTGVLDGDLLAVSARDAANLEYFIASFHGDTEGLQSIPVLEAVHAAVEEMRELEVTHTEDTSKEMTGQPPEGRAEALPSVEAQGKPVECERPRTPREAKESGRPYLRAKSGTGLRPKLLFGLDANAYEKLNSHAKKKELFYKTWLDRFRHLKCSSNWCRSGSEEFDPVACRTTFNARTFLQPQLQKAVKHSAFTDGDCNPKDYILFYTAEFQATETSRDNTGDPSVDSASFKETPIPSPVWPSDHFSVFTTLRRIEESLDPDT